MVFQADNTGPEVSLVLFFIFGILHPYVKVFFTGTSFTGLVPCAAALTGLLQPDAHECFQQEEENYQSFKGGSCDFAWRSTFGGQTVFLALQILCGGLPTIFIVLFTRG